MSRITWDSLDTYTLTAPLVPATTIAAFALTLPSREFSVETNGCGWPAGQILKYPSVPFVGTTVTLSEYAPAVDGIPQLVAGMVKFLAEWADLPGPPNWPGTLRVFVSRKVVF